MLDHYLQRDIVYRLAFSEGERFSELKPGDIENKLFTYHLKKVVAAGYAEKGEDGLYRLTPEGRRVGVGAFREHHMSYDRAYSILILAVQRADGAWLLYRRNTHPLIGMSGFMHTTPIAEQNAPERARAELLAKTGLEASFSVVGSGFFRFYDEGELESFTHFTLLKGYDAHGELQQSSEVAEYYWDTAPDFEAETMLPNMPMLHRHIQADSFQFIEETYQR